MANCKLLLLAALTGLEMSAAAQERFIKHIITADFISEGVAIADINNDGKPDIIAGAWWFEAPNWTKHAIDTPRHYDPLTQFSNSFLDFCMDVNQDGWVDLIRVSLPGEEIVWYENPGAGGASGARRDVRGAERRRGIGGCIRYWRMRAMSRPC